MQLGLVTYMWGAEWDLPTLIKNCLATGFDGVELRSGHKHGVEPTLSKQARADVAKRFDDSGVTLVGLGSACEYHSPDAKVLQKNIDETKAFIELAHDVGASGVKVRPNGLPAGVSEGKTLDQIGRTLRQLAEFGAGYGQEIRLEVHGKGTSNLANVRHMMDIADHASARVCWNSNAEDLSGQGLAHNFQLVEKYLGQTVHIHDLTSSYPWRELFALLKKSKYAGWTLLEEGQPTSDPIRVMKYYRLVWQSLAAS
jgi:sugar phosphate isomerase/epimerase